MSFEKCNNTSLFQKFRHCILNNFHSFLDLFIFDMLNNFYFFFQQKFLILGISITINLFFLFLTEKIIYIYQHFTIRFVII